MSRARQIEAIGRDGGESELMLGDEIPAWATSCATGKIKFATADDARQHLRRGRSGPARLAFTGTTRIYRCRCCGAYHWTSAPRRSDKKKKKKKKYK